MSDAQQANARQIERPPSETEFSESSQELRDVNNKEKREYEADRVRIFMFCYICHKSMENFYTLSDDMKRCCPHIDWESYGMKRTILEEEEQEPENPEANDIFIIETETDTVTTVTRKTYPTPEPIFDPLLNPPVVASNPFLDKMLEEMGEY